MERDRKKICEIFSVMFDNVDETGIYPTTEAYNKLEKYIEQERLQAIGWMHAEACTTIDRGGDIREVEISGMVERAMYDLELCPEPDR